MADAVAASGVDKVLWTGEPGGLPLEAYAPAVAEIVAAAAPNLVITSSRAADRAIMGAVAARLVAPVYTLTSSVEHVDGGTRVTHGLFGGIAEETVQVPGAALLILDGGSIATGGSAPVEEVAATPIDTVRVVETLPSTHEAVDLGKAPRIVAVGRGVKAKDDLALVEALAAALRAEIACSRPLAEGLEWFTHDRYVGVTGQHVSPELYVAIGISGQLQHTVGARSAGVVVAINTDKDCPYFKEADFAVLGDLYKIVPALTEALR